MSGVGAVHFVADAAVAGKRCRILHNVLEGISIFTYPRFARLDVARLSAEYVQRLGLSKLHMSQVQVPPEPSGLPAIPDEEIICSVCFNGDAEDNNAIVICSKCSIGVHQVSCFS